MNSTKEPAAIKGTSSHDAKALERLFYDLPYRCVKATTYFPVYAQIAALYSGKSMTFVEVGVLEGGSLHFWRRLLGDKARIIGIDINKGAVELEGDGFEIFIGSQSDEKFWSEFFESVGNIDVLIDDGGHTFEQQIITCHMALPHINDGGCLVVEDASTSFMREYGGPSSQSFFEYAVFQAKKLMSRNHSVSTAASKYSDLIWSVQFFESIVVFEVNRAKCSIQSKELDNGVAARPPEYFDYGDERSLITGAVGRFARSVPRGGWLHKSLLKTRSLQKTMLALFDFTKSKSKYFR